jgi:hypothetical protein
MLHYGINDVFTDNIFVEAAQLLKEGVNCRLVYGPDQQCGRPFSALCLILIRISDVLADYFACDCMFQRLVEPGEEFGRSVACLLLGQELFGRFSSRWELCLSRS